MAEMPRRAGFYGLDIYNMSDSITSRTLSPGVTPAASGPRYRVVKWSVPRERPVLIGEFFESRLDKGLRRHPAHGFENIRIAHAASDELDLDHSIPGTDHQIHVPAASKVSQGQNNLDRWVFLGGFRSRVCR